MALADGTYIMFNAASPGDRMVWYNALAVDIPGAKDGWTGDLLHIWNRNDSAAQFVQIQQGENGWTYITFMLCNMVLCPRDTYIDGDAMHIGHKNSEGEQVLWSNAVVVNRVGYEAARWTITDSGETTSYMGTAYPMYEVTSVIESNASLKVDKNNVKAGSRLIISSKAGDENNARWVFLPMGTLPKGVYQIHLKNSLTRVLMAADKNESSRIRVGDQGDNVDNKRVWVFINGDNAGGMEVINLESEKAMTISSAKQNATVIQRVPALSDSQLIVPRAAGSVQYLEPGSDRRLDDETWTTYVMGVKYGNNTGISAVATNGSVQSYAFVTDNVERDWAYDQFFFVPTSAFDDKAPVPDKIAHYSSYTGEDVEKQWGLGEVTVQPTWIGSGEYWSCRYKTRYRTETQSSSSRSGWSPWTSIEDGKIANYGWGYGIQPNCQATLADGRWRSDRGVTFSFDNNVDLYEIAYEVRRFSYTYRDWIDDPEVQPDPNKQIDITSHGGVAAKTCVVAKAAYLTLSDLKFSGEGVSIRFGSTFHRGGNAIRIWCNGLFEINESNAPYFGTLKTSTFQRIPANGDLVTVYWTVTTIDGITTSSSSILRVYCAFDDSTLDQITDVTVTDIRDGYLKAIKLPSGVGQARLWVTLDDDVYAETNSIKLTAIRSIEIQDDDYRTFYVPYPFNRPFSIKIYGLTNGVPCVWSKSFKPIEAWTRLWNWGESGNTNRLWFEALYNESEPPTESVNTSASTNFQEPANGSWEIGHVGHAWSQSRSISAIEIDEWNPDAFARLTAMSKCRFAWYRSPRGEIMRVAIVKVNETRHHDRVNYSVEMRRIRE